MKLTTCTLSIGELRSSNSTSRDHSQAQIKKAKHLFCKKCGTKSFYQPRSHPGSYSINLRCVDEPPDIYKVVHFDGKNEFK